MWYDELPPGKSWAALWSDYILCGNCEGIRPAEGCCPICADSPYGDAGNSMQPASGEIGVEDQAEERPATIVLNGRAVRLLSESATGRQIKAAAQAQGLPMAPDFALLEVLADGTSRMVADNDVTRLHGLSRFIAVVPAAMGAEGRYEDWIYLQILEREWKRPVAEADRLSHLDPSRQPSPRAAIVILFWSYFETRIQRLLRAGMRNVPSRLAEDTLQRFSSIGSRLDRLYRLLFETTYWADLTELGFDEISCHLIQVQQRRNAFAHGDPTAIDDALVVAVVNNLKREHEAWIAAYNRRGTSR